jgi:hypothetical protein
MPSAQHTMAVQCGLLWPEVLIVISSAPLLSTVLFNGTLKIRGTLFILLIYPS